MLRYQTNMARAPGSEFLEKIADVTECSICAEIFTNPKLLPCVHTFCLHCLEIYGKEKKPGDQLACPICRNNFVIPDEGFSKLPNNFFIGKIVEIGKIATVSAKETVCDLCGEQEASAEKFCIDCEQKLCDRCSKLHNRIKHCQNHQVVELGSQLNVRELNLSNSYCEHHPKELIKMYCYEDKVAVCLICCVESHQSHRCSNVDKAAGEFTEQLKVRLTKVANRLSGCKEAFQKLEKFKKEFTQEILQTENSIRNSGTQLKELIDQHTETLVQNLRSVAERNLKFFEITEQEVDRFRVMIDSYDRYCEELLTRGSPVDICRAANQMFSRAYELETLPVNCSVDNFYCDTVAFHSANFEILLRQHSMNNVVGEITVTKSSDRILKFKKSITVSSPCESVGVVQKFIPLDSDVVVAITNYMNEDLQKIEAELKECSGNINASKDEPGFIIKGNESRVGKAAKDLLKLKYDYDEVLERRKKRISQTITNLKPHQLSLIGTETFQKKLKQEFPKVDFEMKTTEVNLCGMPDAVRRAKLFLYEEVAAFAQDSFEISELMAKVFAKDEAKPYLKEQLLNQGISASWMCNDRSVVIFAFDDKNLKGAVKVLKKEVVEEHIQLSKASEALVQSSQGKDFVESLCNDNKSLEVALMGPTVVAVCTRNIMEDVRKRLNGFIDKHAVLEKFFPMDLGVVNVITKYLKEDLQKIEAELKECSGNIDTSKDKPGFVINGNETGVQKAEKDLLKLVERIVMYDHDIDRPGLPAYFYSKHGIEVLRGIQMNHKASIQLHNSQVRGKPQAVASGSSEMCRVEVRPGKFMILMRGDITKCKVDAIVNAANEDLKHYGGVAAAIAEAAGFALEEDCLERIKFEGKLLPRQACVTRAGKLPCKKVIHAVGPRWSGGNKGEENILLMAVDSSLSRADDEGLRSIAMPSISTGIFGFPLDLATDIIVDAVKSYFVDNSSTTVREVFFIDNDLRAVASLEKKLRTIQAEGPPQHPEDRREGGRGRRAVAEAPDRRQPTQVAPPNATRRGAFGAASNWIGKKIYGRSNDQIDSTQRTRMIAGPPNQSQEQPEERQPQHLSRIILSIYALSKKAIEDVLKDIEDVIKEYIIDKFLENPQDQESIAKLNPEQIQRIKQMAEIFPVQIEVETGRLKRIRIRGPPMEVTSVIDQVHSIFQEADKKEIKKKEEDWFAISAQLQYDHNSDFVRYPFEVNVIIEKAYTDKKP